MTSTTLTALLTEGKGILAADESATTMNIRLQAAGVPPTEHALARFARLCQEAGVTPIVELELLAEGTQVRCREVTSAALLVTFAELRDYGVDPGLVVLKPNMVLPGVPEAVAAQTVAAIRCTVPERLAGVAFLAGGQSPAQATANLAAIRRHGGPWPLTFCFGRALTGPALDAWRGGRVAAGQRALSNRVACNVAALLGSYAPALEPSYVLA